MYQACLAKAITQLYLILLNLRPSAARAMSSG